MLPSFLLAFLQTVSRIYRRKADKIHVRGLPLPCRAQARQAPRRCGVQALASQKHAILSFCFARLVYFKICMKSIEYISALRVIFWFFAMRIPKVDYFAMICLHSLIRGAWGLSGTLPSTACFRLARGRTLSNLYRDSDFRASRPPRVCKPRRLVV